MKLFKFERLKIYFYLIYFALRKIQIIENESEKIENASWLFL